MLYLAENIHEMNVAIESPAVKLRFNKKSDISHLIHFLNCREPFQALFVTDKKI